MEQLRDLESTWSVPWLRGALLVGVSLRVFHVLSGRSMWFDEACLALNILDRRFGGLAGVLDFHQAAPLSFLWLEKAITLSLGTSDTALRLPLAVAGILSLLLFARIVRDVLPPVGAVVSVLLFAVSWPLIRYSSELKPYGMDVLAAVCVWWWFHWMQGKHLDLRAALASGVAGSVLLWFSYPAALVLASAGIVLVWREFRVGNRRETGTLLVTIGLWAASGFAAWVTTIRPLSESPYFAGFWRSAFMPWPPWSAQWLQWVVNTGAAILRSTLGLPLSPLAAAALLVGVVSLVRRRGELTMFLLLPLAFALLASAAGRYPFTGRFLLFTAPALYTFIGEGVAGSLRIARSGTALLAVWVAVAVLVGQPLWLAAWHVARPAAPQEIKPVLRELGKEVSPTSLLVLDRALLCPFRLYQQRFDLENVACRVIKPPPDGRSADEIIIGAVGRITAGEDVWLLFSDLGDLDPSTVGRTLVTADGARLHRTGIWRSRGVVLFLYHPPESKAGHP